MNEYKEMLVLSGPSGIGKNYIAKHLDVSRFFLVLKTTTRGSRHGEVNGIDYEFLSRDDYEKAEVEDKDFFMSDFFFGNHSRAICVFLYQ